MSEICETVQSPDAEAEFQTHHVLISSGFTEVSESTGGGNTHPEKRKSAAKILETELQ